MREPCVLCHRLHDSQNWKYAQYESVDGMRYGWFCEKWFKPSSIEFIPDRIKEDRKSHAKSMLQPWRGGVASSEYIKAFGTKNFTKEEVRKAKPVWKEILPSNWEKSK